MKKKWIPIIILVVLALLLLAYPTIEIQTDDYLIAFRYTDDISEFETDMTDNENYVYYADRDISIYGYDFKKFLFFHVITMEYVEGNMCEVEYVLEEEYIQNFLENATIKYNNANLDIAELIKGKEAIVGNTRYLGNEYDKQIDYILDGRHETLFVFYVDDLLVIQVGLSDEGPRFIAYKLDLELLSGFPVWYADYSRYPQTPYHFAIWQYTDKGKVDGIDGYVDLDIQMVGK